MIARASNQYLAALRQTARPVRQHNVAPEVAKIVGEARIVMLGESTHGTSEFYQFRRLISEHLIREMGFNFIAVEGDWPDCQCVHAHITAIGKHGDDEPKDVLAGYRRFPTWMWGNEEVLELVEWMRGFNDARSSSHARNKIGFHGLDVYSLHDSMRLVVNYLQQVDPSAADNARRAFACFEPYGDDPQQYALATRFVPVSCEAQVNAALAHITRLQHVYSRINPDHVDPGEAYFDAQMNARVIRNAEAYYRTMVGGDVESWNVRDRHMMEILELLLSHYGSKSKAIVWAHNTHIGDYRATDMVETGYVNIGGLAREQFGHDAVKLIGFTTHHGTVVAAHQWGDEANIMEVPDAHSGSLEDHLHQLDEPAAFIDLLHAGDEDRRALHHRVGHRAIGVVYNPEHERRGQYVPTDLASRYDALIYCDQTQAVTPLDIAVDAAEEPETWPSGL
jgi:erythromycin esterase